MGLREDAEAARLAANEAAAEKKRQEACARERREQERRRGVFETAWDGGDALGIPWSYNDEGEPEHIWVTDPAPEGYTPKVWLHMRSEDGVWLRYQRYRPIYREEDDRWMVVQRCPHDDHWIVGNWSTSLAGIGVQLVDQDKRVQEHIRKKHPEFA